MSNHIGDANKMVGAAPVDLRENIKALRTYANGYYVRRDEVLAAIESPPAAPGIDLSGVRGLVNRWRNANLRADMGWKEALVICLSDLDLELSMIDDSPKGGSDAADMFWNDADPERAFDSIIELVSQEWSNGSVVAGDVMEIQQAIRLPNIKVCVVESEDDGVDYEEAPNTPPVCPKCSGTGFVECGKSGAFVRSGSIQCDCMQATSAEVKS